MFKLKTCRFLASDTPRRHGKAGRAMVLVLVLLLAGATSAAANYANLARLPAAACGADSATTFASGADLTCTADLATQAELDAVALPNTQSVVCTGSDDTSAITTAISAVSSAGGTVRLSAGTCALASTITLPTKVSLIGAGVGATTLKAISSATSYTATAPSSGQRTMIEPEGRFSLVADMTIDLNSNVLSAYSGSSDTGGSNPPTSGTSDLILRDLRIINAGTTAASAYILVRPVCYQGGAKCATVLRVIVECANTSGVNDIGISVGSCDSGLGCVSGSTNWTSHTSDVIGSRTLGCSGGGIRTMSPGRIINARVDLVSTFANAFGLFAQNSDSIISKSRVLLRASTSSVGIDADQTLGITVSDNIVTGSGASSTGITVNGGASNNTITTTAGNSFKGIVGSTNSRITGNRITLAATSDTVGVEAGTYVKVVGNEVSSSSTNAIGVSCIAGSCVVDGNKILAFGAKSRGVTLGANDTAAGDAGRNLASSNRIDVTGTSGNPTIGVAVRAGPHNAVTGNVITTDNSDTRTAGIVCGAQQTIMSGNAIGASTGIRPPFQEGAMDRFDDTTGDPITNTWAAEFESYINCRSTGNNVFGSTNAFFMSTGWHFDADRPQWIPGIAYGLVATPDYRYPTGTTHTMISDANIYVSDTGGSAFRVSSNTGKTCAGDTGDDDYGVNCSTGSTACGGSACTCGTNSDGDGTSNTCSGTTLVSAVIIQGNYIFGSELKHIDIGATGAGVDMPTVSDITITDNRHTENSSSANLVAFPTGTPPITGIKIRRVNWQQISTTPIANWQDGFGLVDASIYGSPACREMAAVSAANEVYNIFVTGPYGNKITAITCSCQGSNCSSMTNWSIQSIGGGTTYGTGSTCTSSGATGRTDITWTAIPKNTPLEAKSLTTPTANGKYVVCGWFAE